MVDVWVVSNRRYGMKLSVKSSWGVIVAAWAVVLLALSIAPARAMADEPAYQAWIGDVGYATVADAVNAAESGATITLAAGEHTLYGMGADTKDKDLTFVGAGVDTTTWYIGAKVPDPSNFGTEYNGDYSFDGAGTITFKDMTLRSGTADYLGFIRADNTVVENCTIQGKTFYWGYSSAVFTNVNFQAPGSDYSLWTYCSPVMTFDGCTFTGSGKFINVYRESDPGCDYVITVRNCTFNSSKDGKAALNINDERMGDSKFIIKFEGTNSTTGLTPDDVNHEYNKNQEDRSCSSLFEFNTKYGSGNSGRTQVSFEGEVVWTDGHMVAHASENGLYSQGSIDNAFTEVYTEWVADPENPGVYTRTLTRTCDYCGYVETETQTGYAVSYDLNGGEAAADEAYDTAIVLEGEAVEVKAAPSLEGSLFVGWSNGDQLVMPGGEIEVTGPATLIAQWTPEETDDPDNPGGPGDSDDNGNSSNTNSSNTNSSNTNAPGVSGGQNTLAATGDSVSVAPFVVLMAAAAAAFSGAVLLRRRA